MALDLAELGLTAEDLITRVVDRILESLDEDHNFFEDLQLTAKKRIYERVESVLDKVVDARLNQAMTEILAETITPVTIWGEPTGETTTLRDALASRARVFWEVQVDNEGKPTTWNGKPRHEHLMAKLLNEEFANAIRSNATEIVAAFKEAVRADAGKLLGEHIEKLIPTRRR